MKRTAWRIVKARHAATAFSGAGAKRYGGRWNSPGRPVVYAAGSISLALLEMLVHLEQENALKGYVLFEIRFADDLVTPVTEKGLPKRWQKSPPSRSTQAIGDAWLASSRSVLLRVPSAIVPTESNYLLNPLHPDLDQITIGRQQPVPIDSRLLRP